MSTYPLTTALSPHCLLNISRTGMQHFVDFCKWWYKGKTSWPLQQAEKHTNSFLWLYKICTTYRCTIIVTFQSIRLFSLVFYISHRNFTLSVQAIGGAVGREDPYSSVAGWVMLPLSHSWQLSHWAAVFSFLSSSLAGFGCCQHCLSSYSRQTAYQMSLSSQEQQWQHSKICKQMIF